MDKLTDIGANLTHDSFDEDRDAVLERAWTAGVRRLIVTGTSVEESEKAAALAATRPGQLWSTAGVHPHHARAYHKTSATALLSLAKRPEVVAIGETGLDYFRDFSPRDQQREAFHAQLAIAAEAGLPAFLHQRDAHHDFSAIVREHRDSLTGAVAHCFTGDRDQLVAYLDLGLYIGITGWICDERRGQHLLELVGQIPLDRLLLETDAPYLMPRTIRPRPRSRRNEPQYLAHVLDAVAAVRPEPKAELAEHTHLNAARLFSLS